MFEFGFACSPMGDSALPSKGMGAIPEQIAASLPEGLCEQRPGLNRFRQEGVTLQIGEQVKAQVVVVATEGPEAARLLGDKEKPGSRSFTCLYFGNR